MKLNNQSVHENVQKLVPVCLVDRTAFSREESTQELVCFQKAMLKRQSILRVVTCIDDMCINCVIIKMQQ